MCLFLFKTLPAEIRDCYQHDITPCGLGVCLLAGIEQQKVTKCKTVVFSLYMRFQAVSVTHFRICISCIKVLCHKPFSDLLWNYLFSHAMHLFKILQQNGTPYILCTDHWYHVYIIQTMGSTYILCTYNGYHVYIMYRPLVPCIYYVHTTGVMYILCRPRTPCIYYVQTMATMYILCRPRVPCIYYVQTTATMNISWGVAYIHLQCLQTKLKNTVYQKLRDVF